jgi:hypothetical protein
MLKETIGPDIFITLNGVASQATTQLGKYNITSWTTQ